MGTEIAQMVEAQVAALREDGRRRCLENMAVGNLSKPLLFNTQHDISGQNPYFVHTHSEGWSIL